MTTDSDDRGPAKGPRGRRLSWSVLDRLYPESGSSPFWRAGLDPDPEKLLRVLEVSLPAVDLAVLSDPAHEELLLESIADAVDSARYWQEPDDLDLTEHSGVFVHPVRSFRTPHGQRIGGSAAADVGSPVLTSSRWSSCRVEALCPSARRSANLLVGPS